MLLLPDWNWDNVQRSVHGFFSQNFTEDSWGFKDSKCTSCMWNGVWYHWGVLFETTFPCSLLLGIFGHVGFIHEMALYMYVVYFENVFLSKRNLCEILKNPWRDPLTGRPESILDEKLYFQRENHPGACPGGSRHTKGGGQCQHCPPYSNL